MRELKFRAWDKVEEKMLFDADPFAIHVSGSNEPLLAETHRNEDCIFEQYTGLKDKNGKEIYEGDILGGIWEDGYIAYCDKCKQFQYHCNGVGCMACSGDVQWYELVDDRELEVIGNIHENPELVKEEE